MGSHGLDWSRFVNSSRQVHSCRTISSVLRACTMAGKSVSQWRAWAPACASSPLPSRQLRLHSVAPQIDSLQLPNLCRAGTLGIRQQSFLPLSDSALTRLGMAGHKTSSCRRHYMRLHNHGGDVPFPRGFAKNASCRPVSHVSRLWYFHQTPGATTPTPASPPLSLLLVRPGTPLFRTRLRLHKLLIVRARICRSHLSQWVGDVLVRKWTLGDGLRQDRAVGVTHVVPRYHND